MNEIIIEHEKLLNGRLQYQHLLNRTFSLGTHDCYALVRDLFRDNLGIILTNYARPDFFWRYSDMNIYVDNYAQEGFQLLRDPSPQDLRPLDCFLIAVPDPNSPFNTISNHAAVYLKNNWVIHHRFNDVSKVEPYKGSLRNLTTHVIRHKDVPDLRGVKTSAVDIKEFLLPHKRAEIGL